ncbi:MAG TPA: UbiA family prenyltransferase [Methanomassiliicoccales archaeon]|jgi:4-hydroxybenzoate polyprenyltransferase|nr:UbiA family prenyltransferase [Methanomassiliicoccales archaeon]
MAMEGSGPMGKRIGGRIDSLLAFLEKDRLNLWQTFAYVLILALARDMLEYYLLDEAFVTTTHPWIFSIAHHVSFFVLTYLGLVLILKVFSGSSLRKCINYTNWYYWIILLPPLIDRFLFGQDTNYAYFSWTDFLTAFFKFEGTSFHPGQAVEVLTVLFALFAYVIWLHRDEMYDLPGRAVLAVRLGLMAVFTFAAMFTLGTPGAYLPVGSENGVPVFPSFDSTKYVQYHLFIFAYYYLAAVVLVLALSYIALRGRFRRELWALRPYQTAFFGGIVLAGTAMAWRGWGGPELISRIFEPPYWVNLAYVVPTVLSAVLAWQAIVLWNDISDREWDSPTKEGRVIASGLLPVGVFKEASGVLAFVSLAVSLLLSVQQFLIMAGILVLAFVYSFPPVRFKNALLSPILMGAGAFLAFLYGAATPFSVVSSVVDAPYLTGEVFHPSLYPEIVMVGLFMFIGLVVGSIITDVDGYEEDRVGGVRTVYTVLGLERGVDCVAVLIFLTSLTPLVLFHSAPDLVAFPALGLAAALWFRRARRSRPVMSIAMVGLLYAALRFLL